MTELCSGQSKITASDFVKSVRSMNHIARDELAVDVLLSGNVPTYMQSFIDVNVPFIDGAGCNKVLVISVLPDYLTIGTDDDHVRIPLSPLSAQRVADAWRCVLPTPKLVTAIWMSSTHLPPQPMGPPYDASMMGTDRFVSHDAMIKNKMAELNITAGMLVSGHKKDVVISARLAADPKKVAIFGWLRPDGSPIQPLSLIHESTYADYSHGIRLISRDCRVNGTVMDMCSIMQDPSLCLSVSDEGPLPLVRQPGS